jgi:hypothetical protein
MPKAVVQKPKTSKCNCNVGFIVLAVILGTLGIYSLATGFISHFNYRAAGVVLLWYFVGVVLMALAKMSKYKAYCGCSAHKC